MSAARQPALDLAMPATGLMAGTQLIGLTGGYRLRRLDIPNADRIRRSSSCAAKRRRVAAADLSLLKAVSASRTVIARARITVSGADIGATGAAAPCDRHSGEQ